MGQIDKIKEILTTLRVAMSVAFGVISYHYRQCYKTL